MTPPRVERPSYECAGGFYIGDDVFVATSFGPHDGRVMGPADPFIRVMLDSGWPYNAKPEELTRRKR